MIAAIAVDDEPVALDIIKAHAQRIPGLQLQAGFLSATEALAYVETNGVNLVFLDINMPGLNGLALAEMLPAGTQFIFTTAYAGYALKGFDLAATDYLLKPINFSRFLQAYKQAEMRLQQPAAPSADSLKTLLVKDGSHWIQIAISSILYIVAEDNYVSIVAPHKRTLTRSTLTEVQSKLPQEHFMRIHKSYIVPLAKIEKLERHQVTIGPAKIPVSRSCRYKLLQQLNTRLKTPL